MTKTLMIKGKIINNFNTINCKSNVATVNHTTIIINTVTITYYNNNNIHNTNNIYKIKKDVAKNANA